MSRAIFGSLPWRSRSQHVRPITLLFEVGFWKHFREMITVLRWLVARNKWVATLKVKVTACNKIVPGQELCYLISDFKNISQKWSLYWADVSRPTFGLLPWRPRSQHDLSAKSCLAQNFVIWSRILQPLLTNYFSVSNTYSGSITRFRPALVLII